MRGVYWAVTPLTLALVATLVSAQPRPDFSGRWTLDAPSPAPADAPSVLVVDPQVLRPIVRGESRPPVFLQISIRREGTSGTTNDTYLFGMSGGLVGPRSDGNEKRAAWRGDTLTLLTRRRAADVPHPGDWLNRRESWSLDPNGRLRVEIETEAPDRARQATLLLYRREQ